MRTASRWVVYHGTDKDFNEFKKSKYGSNGPGIYFTTRRSIAASHGKRVIEAYVKIENDKDGIIAGHEVIVQKPENIKSATGNNGEFDGGNPDIMFSRSGTATAASVANVANGAFRDRMDKIVDTLIYNFQDRFKPLKDIQKRALLVPETQDAVLAEERYSGMVRARTDDFKQDMRDPLIKAIHDEKLDYDVVQEYLHARHAPSRNAAMREINPTEQELKDKTDTLTARRDELAKNDDVLVYVRTRRELRDAEADIEDGIADESLGRVLKKEIATLKKMPAVKEYVGAVEKLRALSGVKPFQGDNTALSGMSNAESAKIISEAKKRGQDKAQERVSALVDGITAKTRKIITEAGLETPETIAAWSEKYQHYVSLYRDEASGNSAHPVGQGFKYPEPTEQMDDGLQPVGHEGSCACCHAG